MVQLTKIAVFCFLIILASQLVPAARAGDFKNHLSLYHGIWADTDLPDLPGKLISGGLGFEDSYFAGLAYSRTIYKDFSLAIPLTEIQFAGWDMELETSLVKHYNLQTHLESNLALVLRTREFVPLDFLGLTFAAGIGGSYAMKRPKLEKGPEGIEGQNSEKFQSHMLLEMDLFHTRFSHLHLVTRVHHRSGIYGLISPQKTGSNFLAVGIRLDY